MNPPSNLASAQAPIPAGPLSPEARRRILARKLQQQRQRALSDSAPEEDLAHGVALSFSQEGLWFLDQMAGGAAYHIHSATRYRGALDADVMERSLRAFIARHESLRTEFHATEQGPVQRVLPAAMALERFSLRQSPPTAHAANDASSRSNRSCAFPSTSGGNGKASSATDSRPRCAIGGRTRTTSRP